MQCTSYFPGYYSHQDLNGPSNGGPWPMKASDINPNMSGQSYNNFYPPQNVDQSRVVYHNEVLRQTMLRHENVFKEQVQELHRLHRRQRELMEEFKMRGLKEPNIVPTSHYNFILSKVSPDCSSVTWQTPKVPTLPWLNPAANKLSTLGSSSPLSAFNFLNASPQNDNEFENVELKKPKRKMLDLELPGDECIDSEEDNVNEVEKKRTFCSSDKNLNVLAFDLNMLPTLFPESEIFQNIETKNGAKVDYDDNSIKERAKYLIDLNSCVDEDEPLPAIPKLDLEAPISPENKESLPPRGESEENLLETQVQISKNEDLDSNDVLNLVSATAETILSFKDRKIDSLIQSLDWFVNVVSNGCEKEKNECIVALPSQQGKQHRKRRMNRKITETETFGSVSSLMSYGSGFGETGLKSWGKVNKRRRGHRVPARSIRFL